MVTSQSVLEGFVWVELGKHRRRGECGYGHVHSPVQLRPLRQVSELGSGTNQLRRTLEWGGDESSRETVGEKIYNRRKAALRRFNCGNGA